MSLHQFVPYWGGGEVAAVHDLLTNSDYLNEHRTVRTFEKEFAKKVGARYCVAVTSGTVALYCAIKSASMKGKVRVPTHDGIFAFNALVAAGVSPIVSDVNEHGVLDVRSDEQAIVVHANGRVAAGVPVIEDCSQATSYHTQGRISTYSFASTKHITTGGQGGAICCDDEETFDALVRLKDHGRTDRQNLRAMSDSYDMWGLNFKLTEMQAAFGLVQLRSLERRMRRLDEMYSIYRDVIGDAASFDDVEPRWYVDIFTPDAAAVAVRLRSAGIGCRPYPRPLHMQGVSSGYDRDQSFPNAEKRHDTGLYLPSTTDLSDEDVKRAAHAVVSAIS